MALLKNGFATDKEVTMSKKWFLWAALSCFLMVGCSDDSVPGTLPDDPNTNQPGEPGKPGEPGVEAVCGDGIVAGSEQCDDGNKVGRDGCSSACELEYGYTCPSEGGACSEVDVDIVMCGNGSLDAGEQCDDSNVVSGDGCASDCHREHGYDCPTPGQLCVQTDLCGNGSLDADEVCDDGNDSDGDGCSADCKAVESGYHCDEAGKPCIHENCGNGQKDDGEACDPGDNPVEYSMTGNGCTVTCQNPLKCGDNIVSKEHGEACDGNSDSTTDYNVCNVICRYDENYRYCGDGLITHRETCDDGNYLSGDGCSDVCGLEPGYYCETPGEPCEKVVVDPDPGDDPSQNPAEPTACGNSVLDAGETCDDGNKTAGDGCSGGCQIEMGWDCPEGKNCREVVCGDGKVEGTEKCDDSNTVDGDGCSSKCMLEAGWICDVEHGCYASACGDGLVAGDEDCDDANRETGDGCDPYCQRETGFACPETGGVCHESVCGDSKVEGDEKCDDGNHKDNDGCTGCQIDAGYECLTPGQACTNTAKCGDGVLQGAEECDEGPGKKTAGCTDLCMIQTGWRCEAAGTSCVKGACGDTFVDKGEMCDDGNRLAGDGCDPFCKRESIFVCSDDGTCKPVCGDGITIWEAGEECDDGNLVSGDGCSSICTHEEGFSCTEYSYDYPDVINLQATYRDFRGYDSSECRNATTTAKDGCITNDMAKSYGEKFRGGKGHPDFQRISPGSVCTDIVKDTLGADGLPVWNSAGKCGGGWGGTSTAEIGENSFQMWYRDYPGINQTFKEAIKLNIADKNTGKYQFSSNRFFPLTDRGYGNEGNQDSGRKDQNFHFTTHIQTYFKFRGNNERLNFTGDDDVWVFVNGKQAIDLGGCHSASNGSFQLRGEKNAETGAKYDKTYELYEGGIYPISFFHAERYTADSNFKLELSGFLDMGPSTCDAVCGDGLIRGNEVCDLGDGHVNDDYAIQHGCVNCQLAAHCGNGVIEAGEDCDGGEGCTESCKYASNINCGNGVVEAPEACDEGVNNGKPGSGCLANCQKAGCGNGVLEEGEECDDGNTSDKDNCTSKCTKPVCGDGVVQGWIGEVCDDGVNDGSYGGCGLGCSYFPPRCGDAIVDAAYEECDNGINNGSYGTCNADCTLPIRCGDGIIQAEYGESCDDGDQNGNGACSIYCSPAVN